MRGISLFSGVGGFDLGFQKAGIETVLQAEQDPHCLKVLERHWPHVERVSDVRAVVRDHWCGLVERRAAKSPRATGRDTHEPDLIFGGFPCQDVSVAGQRAGLSGERSGLWFEFARILGELRPRWCVIENVPGLLSSNSGRDFAVILDGLDQLGYGVAWRILDAQFFGIPQRRRRVFIVGCLGDVTAAAAVLAVRESGGGDTQESGTPGEDLAVAAPLGSHSTGGYRNDLDGSTFIAHELIDEDIPQGQRIYARQAPSLGANDNGYVSVANAISASAGHHGHSSPRGDGSDNLVPWTPETAYALAARNAKGVSLLESQDTFVSPGAGVRRLTPLECERLQGFPDFWTEGQSDSHRYRQLGNAVAVPCAEYIGHRLIRVNELLSE